ncbi:ABC transporter ATP-binding protein/permease [Muribacter muris]|uniref:ABC transporter ATP-binding protein/permease n=1 Tax=Muribacter muris TaxID=67855 RepID=A0A4Y9JT98_9PAST|nr:ABC transporter ATP-binding protein/permease [Muribacter muris]MBF0785721.1 ABC transporter ATP-binding protein/permease [Muribacter muris]MBF0827756.1 ABC transporter ATP-binding protein/permease [Muribacter muris]TFV08798.1 ABC transporter ATP-binding protein/permease [Muribacter muris]
MNWQTELNNSASWLIIALISVSAGVYLVGRLLGKTTFGKKFWHITQPCWASSNKPKTLALMLLLLLMILLEVRISVLNTFFYNGLYSSLQKQQADAFWFFALINLMLVIVKIIHAIINYFLQQVFEIRWLERLNAEMLNRWLANKNYYLVKYEKHLPDNIDQRIEQDATEFVHGTLDAVRGMINALVSTVEFTLILWGLSGILAIFGVEIPKGVVFFIYLFILCATLLSVIIGRPLIKLNFNKEKLQGDYRYSLIRVRDNAESIAFYAGEEKERHHLRQKFAAVIDNRWKIVQKMLGLDGFNTGVTQIAMILPLMLQSQRFFAGQVTLGDMHQTVQSFNRLMRALSFFRLFYDDFTLYQARLNRLYGFFITLDKLDSTQLHYPYPCSRGFTLKNFGVKDANGTLLMQNINIELKNGDALLIQGASGTGKTTLLKALAGIYPFETVGIAERPCTEQPLFLPQRPYMPQGTLRDAICYPHINASDTQIRQVMQQCCLEKYLDALDQDLDWQTTLSPGELQRIAFVRILLSKPELIFLDETTSALDEATEAILYRTIKQALPHSILISVGHRCTLQPFHNKRITLGICCVETN